MAEAHVYRKPYCTKLIEGSEGPNIYYLKGL